MDKLIGWFHDVFTHIDVWIATFTFTTISITVLKNWFVAENNLKPAYWLMIFLGISLACLNTYVGLNGKGQEALLFTNILSVWSILMGIKGLKRLKREKG